MARRFAKKDDPHFIHEALKYLRLKKKNVTFKVIISRSGSHITKNSYEYELILINNCEGCLHVHMYIKQLSQ